MRRIGCMAVHYGKEYLAWAVGALATVVDEVHVFYTKEPSFGFIDKSLVCPDTEEELEAEAKRFDLGRVRWHRVKAHSEQEHRTRMLEVARLRDAELVVIADADEIWSAGSLSVALNEVEKANRAGRWLARFHNFWRSWEWTVADAFRPVRIVDMRHPLDKDDYLTTEMQPMPVFHFGYAQSVETMRYKLSCHGHKAEFKPGWFENVFLGWTPQGDHRDLHPCVNNLWTAESTWLPDLLYLRGLMPDHPHRELAIIE